MGVVRASCGWSVLAETGGAGRLRTNGKRCGRLREHTLGVRLVRRLGCSSSAVWIDSWRASKLCKKIKERGRPVGEDGVGIDEVL